MNLSNIFPYGVSWTSTAVSSQLWRYGFIKVLQGYHYVRWMDKGKSNMPKTNITGVLGYYTRACFRTTYLPVRISLVFICPWPEHYISWHRISGWQTLFHSKLSHKILRIKMRVRWEDLWWRRTSAQASLPWKRYCVKFFHIYMRICSPLPGLTRMRTWSPL